MLIVCRLRAGVIVALDEFWLGASKNAIGQRPIACEQIKKCDLRDVGLPTA